MRMKWQWFLGGKTMFWISILIFVILIIGFVVTYIIDPTSNLSMDKYDCITFCVFWLGLVAMIIAFAIC